MEKRAQLQVTNYWKWISKSQNQPLYDDPCEIPHNLDPKITENGPRIPKVPYLKNQPKTNLKFLKCSS